MRSYFECKCKYVKIDDDGRERKVSEAYLVDALSCTEAEARLTAQIQSMIRGEFSIGKVAESNIVEIFPHETGEYWWKGKMQITVIDENAGKEKRVNNYFLIAADNIEEAMERMKEGLAYILVPYEVTAISLSPIVDVFPYEEIDVIPSNLKPIEE